MVDRRDFIKTVGAGAAFGVASGLPTGKSWADLANITVDDLKPHIGQKFDVRCPQSGNSMQLTLTEVVTNPAWERTQTGQPIPPEFRRPFSLIFQAIGTQPLPTQVKRVTRKWRTTQNRLFRPDSWPLHQEFDEASIP